jgi:hypothetical protein
MAALLFLGLRARERHEQGYAFAREESGLLIPSLRSIDLRDSWLVGLATIGGNATRDGGVRR